MSESANSAKQIFANFVKFVKFVKPIFGTTRRPVGSVTEAEYPTNYQRISNLSLTIRPFRVAILAVLLLFVAGWNSVAWGADVLADQGTNSVELMNGWSSASDKTYTLSGPGATLTFEVEKTSSVATGSITVKAGSETVKTIGMGDLSKNKWKGYSVDLTQYSNYKTNRTIKFSASGTLAKYLRSAKVTMAQYIENPSETSLNFGETDINSDATNKTVTVAWCNVPAMSYQITDDANGFTHVDCFSGVGGFCTGLHAAGFSTKVAIEKIRSCVET